MVTNRRIDSHQETEDGMYIHAVEYSCCGGYGTDCIHEEVANSPEEYDVPSVNVSSQVLLWIVSELQLTREKEHIDTQDWSRENIIRKTDWTTVPTLDKVIGIVKELLHNSTVGVGDEVCHPTCREGIAGDIEWLEDTAISVAELESGKDKDMLNLINFKETKLPYYPDTYEEYQSMKDKIKYIDH